MLSSDFPWATFGVVLLTSVIALVGGGVVIWGHPGALSFNDYIDAMWKFTAAVGILGVGRGVKAGLENHGAASSSLSDVSLLSDISGLLPKPASVAAENGQAPIDLQPAADPAEVVPEHV